MKILHFILGLSIISVLILAGCSDDKVEDITDVNIIDDTTQTEDIEDSINSEIEDMDTDLVDVGDLDSTDDLNQELESDIENVDTELIEFGELI
jgi:outer membrane murein-binding lipoprotein Lpp